MTEWDDKLKVNIENPDTSFNLKLLFVCEVYSDCKDEQVKITEYSNKDEKNSEYIDNFKNLE